MRLRAMTYSKESCTRVEVAGPNKMSLRSLGLERVEAEEKVLEGI